MKIYSMMLAVASLVSIFAAPGVSLGAETHDPRRPGGEVPFPFGENTKVELASGEKYTLVGEVVGSKYAPGLRVDFDEHPWLASAERRENPVYPIVRGGIVWGPWLGKRIILQATAIGQVREVPVRPDRSAQGVSEYRYLMVLKPESDPERY